MFVFHFCIFGNKLDLFEAACSIIVSLDRTLLSSIHTWSRECFIEINIDLESYFIILKWIFCKFHPSNLRTEPCLCQILHDLGTYLNKAIPDTKLTIKRYADVKVALP